MAEVIAILKALSRAERRELGSFLSVRSNNLFLFAVLLAYSSLVSGMKPVGALPFFLLLGLLMLFPMSSDLLSRAPRSRLALWPLTDKQRWGVRVVTLGMNPLFWLAVLILVVTHQPLMSFVFLAVALGARSLSILSQWLTKAFPQINATRYLPQFPGTLGGIVGLNFRQMFSVLDCYAALLLSVAATTYRFENGNTEPAAFPICALLVGLALSTFAQCQFGLDSGLSRYRLFPLRGWKILLAKDIAFLIVLAILVVSLAIRSGLAFGLVAIAVGRYPSLVLHVPQQRWRFTSGDLRFGILQTVTGTFFGIAEYRRGPYFLCAAVVLYLLSLFFGGRYWDRREQI